MQYASQIVSPPMAEPLSLDEVKRHLKVEHDADDGLIQGYIASARAAAETESARLPVACTCDISYSCKFSDHTCQGRSRIELPIDQLRAVTSVKYHDAADAVQTLDPSVYVVAKWPGIISLAVNQSWPDVYEGPSAIVIRVVAGEILPFTVDIATNIFTGKGGGLSDGDQVRLSNSGGGLPGALATDADYFVIEASGTTFKLALTSGGAAIDVTSAGSGISYVGVLDHRLREGMLLTVGAFYKGRDAGADIPEQARQLFLQARRKLKI